MANKYTKKHSTSLAIKEMQIKITFRFYLTPITMAIIKNTIINPGEDAGKRKLIHCWWECKFLQPLWKAV
jgi:hypothetical protein